MTRHLYLTPQMFFQTFGHHILLKDQNLLLNIFSYIFLKFSAR